MNTLAMSVRISKDTDRDREKVMSGLERDV